MVSREEVVSARTRGAMRASRGAWERYMSHKLRSERKEEVGRGVGG
jgi:hypothetical protein